ncbi:MAG: two-component regulator propeller domain-containing protein [Ignavibacteriaceae bacterium]
MIVLFGYGNLSARDVKIEFTHFTSEDGLSLNSVTQILQDRTGFLWFGTYNGLNRYDGYDYKIFLPDPKNPNSISNHSISALCEDKEGYIWVGTLDGLNRYDWKTEEFRIYRNDPNDLRSISSSGVYSVYEDRDGNIWIGTVNGLNKYNRDKDNFTIIKKVTDQINSDFLNSVITIEEDHNGILWLGTWNGLTCMEKNGNIVGQFFNEPYDSKTFDYREISVIYEDKENDVWVGTNGKGLRKYDRKTGQFMEYKSIAENPATISNDYITTIYQDKSGILWIGTKKGFNKYEPDSDSFTRIIYEPLKPLSIINDGILSIYEDNTGFIWVGTSGGVSRFYQSGNKFRYIYEDKKNPNSLASNNIYSIFVDSDDNIWAATFNGFDEIKPDGRIIHHKNNPANPNSLRNNYTISAYRDKQGYVWIGTHSHGLNRYNPATGEYKLYNFVLNDSECISNNGILSACEDNEGNLWFGTWWGLNKFDSKTNKFTWYHSEEGNPNTIRNNLIWDVIKDSEGMIWIGTDGGGASRIDPKTNLITNFISDSSENLASLKGPRVFDIYETSDGILWFGTTDGLSFYDRVTGRTATYTVDDGLPGIIAASLIEDNNGFLWVGTDKGLCKFDKRTNSFTNFSKRQGLTELEFTNNVSGKLKNGTLYFGVKNGIMYFHPDSVKEEIYNAPIIFTDLKIYNQSVPISQDGFLHKSITGSNSINIPGGISVITIEFALLNYSDVQRNRFKYKLEGFDKEWNDIGSRNSATYTNLPPGKYTFIVKASDNNTKRSEKTASLQIRIIPEYYQTWWFKSGIGLAILFITMVTIQLRTQRVHRRNKVLENRVNERTKDLDKTINELSLEIVERKKAEEKVQASLKEKEVLLSEKEGFLNEKEILLKEIHHRVKNNLQVISSLLYLNSRKIKDKEALNMFQDSQNRIKSIALVHERLYQSKDLAKIDFNEYVNKLVIDLFRSYAVDSSVIKIEININDVSVNIDKAVPCGLIINELISNSIKYAFPEYEANNKQGLIKVQFNRITSNKLLLEVSDNGIGIKERLDDREEPSLGLKLVESLVYQLDGKLEMDSEFGTRFKIKFKI